MKEAEEKYGLSYEGGEDAKLFTACVFGTIVKVELEFTPREVGSAYKATVTDSSGSIEFGAGTYQNREYCEEKAESLILHALTVYEGIVDESGKVAAVNQ